MKTQDTTVTARDGTEVPARIITCECGGECFYIYLVGEVHQHLQCIICGVSYCDGNCHHDAQAKTTREN